MGRMGKNGGIHMRLFLGSTYFVWGRLSFGHLVFGLIVEDEVVCGRISR